MGAVQTPEGMHFVNVGGQGYFVDQEALDDLKAKNIPFDNTVHDFSAPSTLSDAARGAAHGVTLGLADTPFGDSNQSVMQRLGGDDYAAVKARSPVASGIGDAYGSTALPIPGAPALRAEGMAGMYLPTAARLAARAVEQGAVGAGTGAVRSYAEGGDPTKGAELGGLLGAAGSAVGDAAISGAQAVAPYIAKAANATADAARTRGVFGIGGSDKQLTAIANRFGLDKLPERLAGAIEALVPPQGLMGRNRSDYVEALDPIIASKGPELGALREEMGTKQGLDALIPDEWSKLRERLQSRLDGISTRTAKGREEANALQRDLEAFDALKQPKTLNGVADVKSDYQRAGHIGPLGSVPEQAAAQSAATMGGETKDTFESLLDHAYDPTRIAHDEASREYGVASMLRDQIAPKSLREQFNTNAAGAGSVLASMAGQSLVGAAVGAAGGSPFDHAGTGALTGALLGAGHGAQMAAGTGTRNLLTQVLSQPKAMDTIANISRAAGKKLSDIDLKALEELVRASGSFGGYVGSDKP
jgi:hypothetical protein